MPIRFNHGRLMITAQARSLLHATDIVAALSRHLRADWGDLCEEDKQQNDAALECGGRLLSAYADRSATRFWIITEADRSSTTILLPSDY